MMHDEEKLSASLEDYLEAIFHIANDKGAAKAKDIANRLNVNSSSVTGALRSLAKRNLVNYTPYDVITLTAAGEKVARNVVRRHKALREFLVIVLQVDEPEAEETACKMEHVVSQTVLERFIAFHKFVTSCPIGGAQWVEGKGFVCEQKGLIDECIGCENFNDETD
ncbi:MAG: metal-dependent transcriptional regulator [Candidatus Electryoneaceae bacterium]|nr:metal-dependent transcriptional regulator [Candidatus Electryoneaceae bacterium]